MVIWLDNTAHAFSGIFHYTDFTMIAAVILMVSDRPLAAFIFAAVSSVFHDMVYMPFTGFSLASKTGALLFARVLCQSLYRENFPTRSLILFLSEAAKELFYACEVAVFYSPQDGFRFPAAVVMRIVFTTLAGMALLKLMDPKNTKGFAWPSSRKILPRG